ncbi:MAG: hypothetical protein R3E31_31220, partial [Chloroflexota bacterium]
PVVFLGLLAGIVLLWQRPFRVQFTALPLWIWVVWPLLFIAGISVAAKKFDRYLLPAIPALTLLAAVVWNQVRLPRGNRWLLPVLVGAQMAYLLTAVPYPLAAYNPLLGGPPAAAQLMTVGWGEAIGTAGSWLTENQEGEGATAVASIAPSLAPFFAGTTLLQSDETLARADYVVVTAADRQADGEQVAALTQDMTLLHTIHYAGLDQAWIYQQAAPLPPLLTMASWAQPVRFGAQVQVWGVAAVANAKQVDVLIRWGLREPTNGRFTVKLLLRDDEGHLWAWREIDLVNEVAFYPVFWESGARPDVRYAVPLPPAMPPGSYTLELMLFDSSGAQQPVLTEDGRFQGVRYTQDGISIPQAATPPPLVALDIPVPMQISWSDGLLLLGHDALPANVITGGQLDLDLYWQAAAALPATMTVTWHLGAAYQVTLPLSRYDTAHWLAGDMLHEKYTLPIPPDMPGGWYTVRVGDVALGDVEVIATDRLFTLPADIPVGLDVRFGDGLYLRGFRLDETAVPGRTTQLTLYWQAETVPDDIVTVFVHVVNAQGEIVTQADQWPGGLPSNTWAAGQVIVDDVLLDIPADLPAGDYQLAVGVYMAENGIRWTATDAEGTA